MKMLDRYITTIVILLVAGCLEYGIFHFLLPVLATEPTEGAKIVSWAAQISGFIAIPAITIFFLSETW